MSLGIGLYLYSPNPTEEVMAAMDHMRSVKSADTSVKVSFQLKNIAEKFINSNTDMEIDISFKEAEKLFEMFTKTDFACRFKYAFNDPEQLIKLQTNLDIDYDEESLLSLMLYADNERAQVGVTNLYDKVFEVSFVNLLKQMGIEEFDVSDIVWVNYRDILFNQQNSDDITNVDHESLYDEQIKLYLDEHLKRDGHSSVEVNGKKIRTNDYKLTLEPEDYERLMLNLFDIAKDDKALQNEFKKRLNACVDYFIESGDYQKFNLKVSQVEQTSNLINRGFPLLWNFVFNQLEKVVEGSYLKAVNEVAEQVELVFSIDKDQQLKQFSYNLNQDDDYIIMTHIIHAVNEDVDFEPFQSIAIFETLDASKSDHGQMARIVSLSVLDEMLNSPQYKMLYHDLTSFDEKFDVQKFIVELERLESLIEATTDEELTEELTDELFNYIITIFELFVH